MLKKEREDQDTETPQMQDTDPKFLECVNCGHNIDNHNYKGCAVKRCHCKIMPSQIIIGNLERGALQKKGKCKRD